MIPLAEFLPGTNLFNGSIIAAPLAMKILLISPRTPDTFWSFKHAIRFVSRKASMAPLGLLTVAAMLPPEWELKLVDLNVEKLKDEDVRQADYVLLDRKSTRLNSSHL